MNKMNTMMKFCIVLLLHLVFFQNINAQSTNFAPVGAKWWVNQIISEPILADSFVIVEVTGEELKEGELCRVISNLSGCGLPNPAHVFNRNDSVFFFSERNNQFELLYDFKAEKGSSWVVKGLSNLEFDIVVSVLDVGEGDWFGKVHKFWSIETTFNVWGQYIVENVGSLWYPGPTTNFGCFANHESYDAHRIRCYEYEDELYSFTFIDCDSSPTIVSSKEESINHEINIFPNPASEFIILDGFMGHKDLSVKIFDLSGTLVLEKRRYIQGEHIEIGHLTSGSYIVLVYSQEKKIGAQKFLLQ